MPRPPTGSVLVIERERRCTYALRFRAGGKRRYQTLGTDAEGWTQARADTELENVLADVRRGIWQPSAREPAPEPEPLPDFHTFASAWYERHKHEVSGRTREYWLELLSPHLLPYFARYRLDQITPELVDRYRFAKLRERERWDAATPEEHMKRLVPRGLGKSTINKTLAMLQRILAEAMEYGYVESNAAAGRKRRVRADKPRRTWLEPHEAQAVLEAAGTYRPLLAAMLLGGLRVGEATALRWRDLDLAGGNLRVSEAKTPTGVRTVQLTPMLREELVMHRADSRHTGADELVFCSRHGTPLSRSNIRIRGVGKAVERANVKLVEAGYAPIADGITNHSLRRTFASLLYEAGASPAFVMAQMGHTSSALALEIYAKKMAVSRDTGARMDALIQAADWRMGTALGTKDGLSAPTVAHPENAWVADSA